MHRGFKLNLYWDIKEYFQAGFVDFKANESEVKKTLEEFDGEEGVLNGWIIY